MSTLTDPKFGQDSGLLFDRMFKDGSITPEQRLWGAVILRFLFDVQRDYLEYRDSLNGGRNKYWNRLVTHRITASQRHMEMLCDFAGLNHDCLIEKVHQISEGTYWIDYHAVKY